MKENVKFWQDWDEAIRTLPEEEQGEAYRAVMDYALRDIAYSGKNAGIKMLLTFLIPRIDVQNEEYAKVCERNQRNGQKGGRPRNPEKPTETQENPLGIFETQENPEKPDKGTRIKDIGVRNKDKGDIEKNTSSFGVSTKKEGKKSFNISSYLESKGVQPAMIEAWLAIRKTKRATNTEAAMQLMEREIGKVKMTWDEVIQECVLRNWVGFKAEWILKDQVQQAAPEGQDDMDAMAKKWRQELEAMRAADGRVPGQFKDL